MQRKAPKNSDRFQWTQHSIMKMQLYGLSEQKVLGIIRRPKRKEEGIVKNTVAVMQPISPKIGVKGETTWKTEIWAMYQLCRAQKSKVQRLKSKENENSIFQKLPNNNQKLKIISAWRYPGVSPRNNPIPEDILREISQSVV